MRGGRRAQVTLFIFIGLGLLSLLLLLLFLRNSLTPEDDPTARAQEYDAKSIESYVLSCMDTATEEALVQLGQQGGILFDYQDGLATHKRDIAITGKGVTNISFGLMYGTGWPFAVPLPSTVADSKESLYPRKGVTLEDLALENIAGSMVNPFHQYANLFNLSNTQYDGLYGEFALPMLCDANGAAYQKGKCDTLFTKRWVDEPSIEQSLDHRLEKRIGDCIDPEELSAKLGAAVTVGTPEIELGFPASGVAVTLTLPLTFTNDAGTLKKSTFSREYDVRLSQLYTFLFNYLKRASKDANFDMTAPEQYRQIIGYDRFVISRTLLTAAQAGGRSDVYLIGVQDPVSAVKKDAYFFQFLVEDRRPILSAVQSGKINPETGEPYPYYVAVDSENGDYPTGGTLFLNARDPDGQVNLTPRLTFVSTLSEHDQSCMGVSPITGATPGLRFNFGCTICDGPYLVNISVKDESGLEDWAVYTAQFNCPYVADACDSTE